MSSPCRLNEAAWACLSNKKGVRMDSENKDHVIFKKGNVIIKAEAAYPSGALVVDGYDERRRLMAHPLGGGPQDFFKPAVGQRIRGGSEGEQNPPPSHA